MFPPFVLAPVQWVKLHKSAHQKESTLLLMQMTHCLFQFFFFKQIKLLEKHHSSVSELKFFHKTLHYILINKPYSMFCWIIYESNTHLINQAVFKQMWCQKVRFEFFFIFALQEMILPSYVTTGKNLFRCHLQMSRLFQENVDSTSQQHFNRRVGFKFKHSIS